jgi:hypothetical protein
MIELRAASLATASSLYPAMGLRVGVEQNRKPSQIRRLERAAGHGIIAPRRGNSEHLHRPWRAG